MEVDNEDLINRLDELIEQQKRIADALEVIATVQGINKTLDRQANSDIWSGSFNFVWRKMRKIIGGDE